MKAQQLWFVKPFDVAVQEEALPGLQPGQLLLKTRYSAISAGTEMLVYRGQLPADTTLDDSLAAYEGQSVEYPLQYGYACVCDIEAVGADVASHWVGKTVFAFMPHASHHLATLDAVIEVPKGIDAKQALFLANMETAVNLAQDGNPRLGERAIVLGQGIVGLLLSGVLAQFPLDSLAAVEALPGRRTLAQQAGVPSVFDPNNASAMAALHELLALTDPQGGGADVVFELTGSPEALNLAVDLCAYSGTVVVGSWYGSKRAETNLGERFHRNRINIVSSQVSSIAPELGGRWNKARRFAVAWDMISRTDPARLVSHCIPFAEAAEAYRLLDQQTEESMQVIFEYPE